MDIVNFGFFKPSNINGGFVFYENEDGQDWYSIRPALTTWKPEDGSFVDAVFGVWATARPDGTIWNVETDPSRLVPDNSYVLGIDAEPGEVTRDMRWDKETNTLLPALPAPVVIPEVTMRQAKLALLRSGMLDEADAIIAAMAGDEGREAQIEWEYGSTLERDHPLVAELGTKLELPSEQIDALFIWAAGL